MKLSKQLIAAITTLFMKSRLQEAENTDDKEEKQRLIDEAVKAFIDTIKLFDIKEEEILDYFHLDTFESWFFELLLQEAKKFYNEKL
ncbi:hypothetical protein TMA_074 [Thermus phage TMA]|uniref:hypothetical protein n=1 Tax=Thermus phage TMA TaxID=699370 RepID=UPI00021AAE57|nr:hypothetical protein TMA_074 [Thermus phage TMA]BAK53762.1 hypothetical protein TMA_074 [Thermus phage TMA]